MTGKLAVTEFITMESDESQWRMLTNGLINQLKTTGLVRNGQNKKVRIKLIIEKIIPPENGRMTYSCNTKSTLGNDVSKSMSRSVEFLNNFLDKKSWLFFGYINGENKVPIFIYHYGSINLSIFTQKLANEDKKTFFPNAQLN